MKTITIILIILFLAVSTFFGFLITKKILGSRQELSETEADIQPEETTEEEVPAAEEQPEEEAGEIEEIPQQINPSKDISKIEIYLDGDKDNGIFLGEAQYGLPSEDITLIYGENFLNSGFSLIAEGKEYTFEPGSIHCIYIYTFITEYGWEYLREEVQVPGEPATADSIRMSIDSLFDKKVITSDEKKEIRLSGWAADLSIKDSPGIDRIEVYLDGPSDFGKFLGKAQYGLERKDVAAAYGNPNYSNCGYYLTYDGSSLEPGSTHSFYVYAHSITGEYQFLKRDVLIEGTKEESNVIVSFESNFGSEKIEIEGWAVSNYILEEGGPRPTDIEYALTRIAFVSNRTGNEDIFSMNLDGSEPIQLTDYTGRDMYPAISPDGKKIAYSSDIGGSWQIVVMNWDGSGKTQITTNPERNGYPTWSFDGRYIFFEMFIDGNWEIYRMDSDGSNMKRLTFNNVDDWHPSAHPYQYKVLYESGTFGHEEIYIIDHNGENNKNISNSDIRNRVPKMSIDGKKIVFMGYEGNNADIFTIDSNGGNLQKLTNHPESAGLPAFSPDNKYIVYNAKINGNDEIFIMNIDGSNPIQLTSSPGDDWGAAFIYQASSN